MLRFLGVRWVVASALWACSGTPQESAPRCDADAALPALAGARVTQTPLRLDRGQVNAVVAVGSNDKLICSAVLVQRDEVVTAKHCVKGLEAGELSVHFGQEFACPEQTLSVAAIRLHPTLDVAVLRLAGDAADSAAPIAWGSRLQNELSVGDALQSGGFGRTAQGTLGSRRFISTTVAELGSDIDVNGGGAPGLCTGDSGAPLLGRIRAGSLVIWGTLRGGSPTCNGRDRFVRADDASEWLLSQ